jgi:aldose 1-epimerase
MSEAKIEQIPWGPVANECNVSLFTLRNETLEIQLSDYGARLVAVRASDRSGVGGDVVLGFDALRDYVTDTSYMGATVGRYANRIAGGTFDLEGQNYSIHFAEGQNHALHGGAEDFDRRVWQSTIGRDGVRMNLISPDGDMWFLGTLDVIVKCALRERSLSITFDVKTDKTTIVNLSNHAYFDLSGGRSESICDHMLEIAAYNLTEIDAEAIPTGRVLPVEGTSLDCRWSKRIGDDLDHTDLQMRYGDGYNHNFVLRGATELLSHSTLGCFLRTCSSMS